jgi:hypothetical protein
MKLGLELAREYAQLWAEYHTLQEQTNKLQPHDIRWQIITDFKTHISGRLNDINQKMANAYKQTERKR